MNKTCYSEQVLDVMRKNEDDYVRRVYKTEIKREVSGETTSEIS